MNYILPKVIIDIIYKFKQNMEDKYNNDIFNNLVDNYDLVEELYFDDYIHEIINNMASFEDISVIKKIMNNNIIEHIKNYEFGDFDDLFNNDIDMIYRQLYYNMIYMNMNIKYKEFYNGKIKFYKKKTKNDLIKICKDKNIKNYSKYNKNDLIKYIMDYLIKMI